MKRFKLLVLFAAVLPAQALGAPSKAPPAMAVAPAPAWHVEVKQVFGFVPGFMMGVPPEAGDAWWMGFKGLYLGETALPGKIKSMISIAVASQIPCQYCTYADTTFAMKLEGASQREVNEAVMMASITRLASTILNGSGQEEADFKKEADAIFAKAKKGPDKAMVAIEVKDGPSALKDVQQTFGLVPTFIKRVPDKMQAPLWLMMKNFQLNPATALPNKYKELIGLGVAAQIPCKYCMYFHREAARLNGATQAEIDEAVTVAGDTRAKFKKEIDAVVKNLQKSMK